MLEIVEKYEYPALKRVDDDGKRLYMCPDGKSVPSVTRILSETRDMSGLKKWVNRVGEEEASRIRIEAATVGTFMHNYLESYILGTEYIKLHPCFGQAKDMAKVIIKEGLKDVDEIWGTEVRLFYPEKYAGTTDLVGIYKGKPTIIDYKQTNKPKKKEWIEDYYLQLCAYAHAHNKIHGTDIKNGVILMCSRDMQMQIWELPPDHFYHYSTKWFSRLEEHQSINT